MVAGAIALAHLVALHAVVTNAPRIRAAVANAPLAVHFIDAAEPQPEPLPPPPVRLVAQIPETSMPVIPLIEVPLAAVASERAITGSVRPDVAHEGVGEPRLISTVEYVREPSPRYPPQSRRLREQGLVVLRVLIDERGTARNIEIESSSGHERLDAAAREAVARAVFRPYVEDGAPKSALVLIPIEFALHRGSA